MTAWTQPRDALNRAAAIWRRGTPLAVIAAGAPFDPVRIPVKGPAPAQRSVQYEELRRWLETWRKVPAPVRVEWRTVNDRLLGSIQVPVAAYLDTVDDLARAAAASPQLASFRTALESTPLDFHPFMARRPHRVLEIGADWPAVVGAALWLTANPASGLHPRQIPVAGVHSKIVETFRREIADMTAAIEGVPGQKGKDAFANRFGLATKPLRVRLRFLDQSMPGCSPYSDVEVPTSEVAQFPVQAARILVVENEIPFLSLPPMPGTVALLGNGNAAPQLIAAIPWVRQTPIVYWGDIDTWGFVILDRVRAVVGGDGSVVSILMDRGTLLGHRDCWVHEDTPMEGPTQFLTDEEQLLYSDLARDRLGRNVRLEQERIPAAELAGALKL
ncbi:MAG: Wadjet anti-phage system protein JetD domain-containing protein [Sporichthyaceae bacterium]